MRLKDLIRISEYEWEIPKDYRSDMRVPVRIFATRELLEAVLEDKSLEQAVNAATLPGVVGRVLVMPDVHQGYGFPIGGVAATKYPEGIISPGAIGYDINCLPAYARVLHEFGYTRPIGAMAHTWRQAALRCFRLEDPEPDWARPALWFGQRPKAPMLRLVTESGDELVATADHPVWTSEGMVPLEDLKPGMWVARYPFEGVPYEEPSDEVVLSEEQFRAFLKGLGKSDTAIDQSTAWLKARGLLPLTYRSPQLPLLLRILGYLFGDGTVTFTGKRRQGMVQFYGQEEDLRMLQQDLARLGFRAGLYTRTRQHRIQTPYREYTFTRTEIRLQVASTALAGLLAALGAPVGNKARQDYDLPAWLEQAPLWQQRLFLAGLFGAELTAPQTVPGHPKTFASPVLSMTKGRPWAESGRRFLDGLRRMLAAFGVRTRPLWEGEEVLQGRGEPRVRLRLLVESDAENLLRLWGRIGFEYNRKRQARAMAAVLYLKVKQRHLAVRAWAEEQARVFTQAGEPLAAVVETLEREAGVNRRFVERSLYRGRVTGPRPAHDFPTFEAFLEERTRGLGESGMVWDRVVAVEPAEDEVWVYDFTMDHPDHNFVAEGFVVSNCGVRLLATRLPYEKAEPYLDTLATLIDQYCPSGVGRSGHVKISTKELDRVAREGARWALQHGYATKEDLERTEEGGRLPHADPSKVSGRAKERGRTQLGTVGAGNHFIEVDVIEQIFDEEAARAFGLEEGMLAVQIHCGSRGYGHQICSDYVRDFQKVVHRYGIRLPDRELVCAPLNSPEGQDYLGAMQAAANFAFCNRQILAHFVRRAFEETFRGKARQDEWYPRQVYDLAHNIGKIEVHDVDGKRMKVCVHRKGATRAFGPHVPGVPAEYWEVGQPVLVPGSMGTASWVLVGTEDSMKKTFGSSCHGAGRVMSRAKAKKTVRGEKLLRQLEGEGIRVRAGSMRGLAEEAPFAYKDVDLVVETVVGAGIARKVARLRPVAVIKG